MDTEIARYDAQEERQGLITIPDYLGSIEESWNSPSARETIVHIQDAHCNYAAQHKIAEIIEYLNAEYEVDTVNLEGGEGRYDLSVFDKIENKEVREKTADFFLKEGLLNGAEYFAAVNPGRVNLWGAENTELYLKNLNVYRESLAHKEERDAQLNRLKSILGNLKRQIYSPELLELDGEYARYKSKAIEFKEYLEYLAAKAKQKEIAVESFSNVHLLLRSLEKENNINFKKADLERDALIDALRKIMADNELENLVLKIIEFRSTKLSSKAFYAYLTEKAECLGINFTDFPELRKYIAYISAYNAADKTKLMGEIDALENALKAGMFENAKQKRLALLSKNLVLTESLFNIALTRADYEYYKRHKKSFNIENYVSFIEEEAPLYNIAAELDKNITRLNRYREEMAEFYEYSFKRDRTFLENIKLDTRRQKITVLVTGGFHTENLLARLKTRGVSYISIMPKFTNEEEYESPYFDILAGKPAGLINYITANISTMAIYSYFCGEKTREIHSLGPDDIAEIIKGISGLIQGEEKSVLLLKGELRVETAEEAPRYGNAPVEEIPGLEIGGKKVWAVWIEKESPPPGNEKKTVEGPASQKQPGRNIGKLTKLRLLGLIMQIMAIAGCNFYGPFWKPYNYDYVTTGLDNLYEVTDTFAVTQPHYVYIRDDAEIFIYDDAKGYIELMPQELEAIVDALNMVPIDIIRNVSSISVKELPSFLEDTVLGQAQKITRNIILYATEDTENGEDGGESRRLYGYHELESAIEVNQKGMISTKTLNAFAGDAWSVQTVALHEAAHVFSFELQRRRAEAWDSFKELNERSEYSDNPTDYAREYGMKNLDEDWATMVIAYIKSTNYLWGKALSQARRGYPVLLEKTLLVSQFFIEEDGEQLRAYVSAPGRVRNAEFWPVSVVDNRLSVGEYNLIVNDSGVISGMSESKTSEIENFEVLFEEDYEMETLEDPDGTPFMRLTVKTGAGEYIWSKRTFGSIGDYLLFKARGPWARIKFMFNTIQSEPFTDVDVFGAAWETYRVEWPEDLAELLAISMRGSVDVQYFEIHYSGAVFPGSGINAEQFINRITPGGAIGKFQEPEPVKLVDGRITGRVKHIETGDEITLANLKQETATLEEITKYINDIRTLMQQSNIPAETADFLNGVLADFTQNLPKNVILTEGGKGIFFGKGDAGEGFIAIDKALLKASPLSFLHEVLEYAQSINPNITEQIENLFTTSGKEWLADHAAKYAAQNNTDYFTANKAHYTIRAFTRQVFTEKDKQTTDVIKGAGMYEVAKTLVPAILTAMRKAPTHVIEPVSSLETVSPVMTYLRETEQKTGKKGHNIHARSYLADSNREENLINEIHKVLPGFYDDVTGFEGKDYTLNKTRMVIRLLGVERDKVRTAIKDKLIERMRSDENKKDLSQDEKEEAAEFIIKKKIRFVNAYAAASEHLNTVVDLFTDITMVECDRYGAEDGYPNESVPQDLSEKFLRLLSESITNYDQLMEEAGNESDITAILKAIFSGYVLRIQAVDWESIRVWKDAQDQVLKSL